MRSDFGPRCTGLREFRRKPVKFSVTIVAYNDSIIRVEHDDALTHVLQGIVESLCLDGEDRLGRDSLLLDAEGVVCLGQLIHSPRQKKSACQNDRGEKPCAVFENGCLTLPISENIRNCNRHGGHKREMINSVDSYDTVNPINRPDLKKYAVLAAENKLPKDLGAGERRPDKGIYMRKTGEMNAVFSIERYRTMRTERNRGKISFDAMELDDADDHA
jgi:hypothetical protein